MNTGAKTARQNATEAADRLYAEGRYQEALDVLTTPAGNLAEFYALKGDILLALNRNEEAAGSFFTSATLDPSNRNGYANYRLGVCLHRVGRWPDACQAFFTVLELNPQNEDVRLALGACLLHMNRPEEALAHFERCGKNTAQYRGLFGRGVALQMLKRYPEAQAAYERLLALSPKFEEALANLIAMYQELNQLDKVRHYASRLFEISPDSTTALQGLAAVALERNEYEAAFRYCSRIVEQSPDCVEAWQNLRFASGRVMSTLRMSAAAGSSTQGRT